MTARIRKAGLADLETLVATRVALFRELGHAGDEEAFQRGVRERLAELLPAGTAIAWLALAGAGEACGSAILLVYPRLPSPANLGAREGYVLNVYVSPEHRRRGAASALIEAAIAEARSLGLARLRLHATPDGGPVYARAGFRRREDEMELVL